MLLVAQLRARAVFHYLNVCIDMEIPTSIEAGSRLRG